MKISQHFSREEFACKCGCGMDTVDVALISVLEKVRNHFNAAVHLNSGSRCIKWNESKGGSAKSQHLLSKAADIVVTGISPEIVAAYLMNAYPDSLGIGMYHNFTHVDVRPERARW